MMRSLPWRSILTALFSLWAINGALHIFIGMSDDYERMSGRGDFHIHGGAVQLFLAIVLIAVVRSYKR